MGCPPWATTIRMRKMSLEGCHSKAEAFASDGEGFSAYVLRLPEQTMCNLQLPYTDYPGLSENSFPITPDLLFQALAESQKADPGGHRRKALDEVLKALQETR